MATYGPNVTGSAGTNQGTGNNWSGLSNTAADDGTNASATTVGQSKYLTLVNFGFAITNGETIAGITVVIQAAEQNDADGSTLDEVYLTKNGTATTGTNQLTPFSPTATMTNYTVGGASNLWGTTWTEAEVEASTFGVMIKGTKAGTSNVLIDYVTVTVDTTAGGGGGSAIAVMSRYYAMMGEA